jgi:uncharacterized membrane protein
MLQVATFVPEVIVLTKPVRVRLEAVDLLRGLLMLLMALDHTRDYFSSVTINPTDPLYSWPALYITRWVTHLCAPGFVALTGTSVYLQRQRGKSPQQVTRLLWTRGLWFLLLDVTLISFAWSFTFRYPYLNIIWTIGLCMIGLAFLQRFSIRTIGVIGVLIVLLHNLLDPIQASSLHEAGDLWILIHQRGFLLYNGHPFALVYFPALSWFGIMCLGYCFGPVLSNTYSKRLRTVITLAVGCLLLFAVLRISHGYGDSYQFQHFANAKQSIMSFFELQKYPASLQYTLATCGILLLLYAFFDTIVERNRFAETRSFFEVYGRVPFLFYVLHIFLIHTAALLATYAAHGDWRFWIGPGETWVDGIPANWGYSLPVVYAVWVGVVIALYPACRWFSHLKGQRRDWWLSYL